MEITKSVGVTKTEKLLSQLCDKTFLKLWSYSNPFKSDRKELCDLIAVFENHVFLFFDRSSPRFDTHNGNIHVAWTRWERDVIRRQISTARGATRYLLNHPNQIFLGQSGEIALPIPIPSQNIRIHRIIIAHGAKEACEHSSNNNVYGSLAISYSDPDPDPDPKDFMIDLERENPVHVFDSHNLEIIFNELDTFHDFKNYITAKEEAIKRYKCILYCGEEDLLAHYFQNFDESNRGRYYIGTRDEKAEALFIEEGIWREFIESSSYKQKKEASDVFSFWDKIIQDTSDCALNGSARGNCNIFHGPTAIHEMAKEPRFMRSQLSKYMINAIESFPKNISGTYRQLTLMRSLSEEKAYVFLQVSDPNIGDYDSDYRPKRQELLEDACGVAKNKFPYLKKVVGIAIDAPKFSQRNSVDLLLMDCEDWPDERRIHFEQANSRRGIFESNSLRETVIRISDLPVKMIEDHQQ